MSNDRIVLINIEDHMKAAYIDYSMSVIVSRALPDVRDGLKPVHRRVLFGMEEASVHYNKAHKKSARIVGDVLGKYHPHGDSSVYDALVRMAQPWSLRYPLIDGQGNFGSIDGDSPAAMRYTEVRLRRIADEILADINKETVDFTLNYDDSLEEPSVLPTKIPNLLINGSSGIAVGMATNMLPHNLREVIDGIVATVDNPEITIDELMQFIKAPDFPTGGTIYGTEGIREAFHTGRGKIVVRAKSEFETKDGREQIVVTEVPYQVNKAMLAAKIGELVNDKKIEGIHDVRDESSDRGGIRLVIELRKDAIGTVVQNQLYKQTELQKSFGVNNVALVGGRPMILNLKDLITEFIKFRLEVIVRRTQFDLRKAKERAHILEGLYVALDDLDRIITIIRAAKNPDEAQEALSANVYTLSPEVAETIGVMEDGVFNTSYSLSEIQAKAILEMRLQRLTGLERDKIKNDYDELKKVIANLNAILESEEIRRTIIKTELAEIRDRFGDDRRTNIVISEGQILDEDLIEVEDLVITISHLGYIKRTAVSEFRAQGRGGRGARGAKTRDEDFVEQMFVVNSHDYLLFFSEKGKCFWLRGFEIPEGSKTSSGRVIQNILSMPSDDKVRAFVKVKSISDPEFINNNCIIFCTRNGIVKKTLVEQFSRPRQGGITAINIREGDQLLEAKLVGAQAEIMMANRNGRSIRFNADKVRPTGRSTEGVIGMELDEDGADAVVGMIVLEKIDNEATVLIVSENGYGKRSKVEEYRITNRGGKGVATLNVTEKTGRVVAIKSALSSNELMITTKAGITIRMGLENIPILGRATQGVRVIRLDDGEEIADVALIDNVEVEDVIAEDVIAENLDGAENNISPDETSTDTNTETVEVTE